VTKADQIEVFLIPKDQSVVTGTSRLVHLALILLCLAKGLDTCYSATYMSQTRDQQHFIISEVAADWR